MLENGEGHVPVYGREALCRVFHRLWTVTARCPPLQWRVRIVLEWKGLAWTGVPPHLRLGEQYAPDYLALNLQGSVPALEMGGDVLTQSLAICEFLDETHAQAPLLPKDTLARAKVRAAAQVIACDIHPT
ncbi:glutathione S-transferase N-terminal domain-containing protein [Novosphingobium sp. AAP83]|uniref:glutathione S-transferase N-terminal domain-containing protein n=1 Tax=Novosphingobium sp. AAP83 TaxID=1523425 RepID=UPI0021009583|nr:glutathione S-transferase N-terminal domain-containing protein [Novosphingobium sp. AAP83]